MGTWFVDLKVSIIKRSRENVSLRKLYSDYNKCSHLFKLVFNNHLKMLNNTFTIALRDKYSSALMYYLFFKNKNKITRSPRTLARKHLPALHIIYLK